MEIELRVGQFLGLYIHQGSWGQYLNKHRTNKIPVLQLKSWEKKSPSPLEYRLRKKKPKSPSETQIQVSACMKFPTAMMALLAIYIHWWNSRRCSWGSVSAIPSAAAQPGAPNVNMSFNLFLRNHWFSFKTWTHKDGFPCLTPICWNSRRCGRESVSVGPPAVVQPGVLERTQALQTVLWTRWFSF